jgi:hypothetical protein
MCVCVCVCVYIYKVVCDKLHPCQSFLLVKMFFVVFHWVFVPVLCFHMYCCGYPLLCNISYDLIQSTQSKAVTELKKAVCVCRLYSLLYPVVCFIVKVLSIHDRLFLNPLCFYNNKHTVVFWSLLCIILINTL